MEERARVKTLKYVEEQRGQQLPLPSSIASQTRPQVQKRNRSLIYDSCLDEQTSSKRPRANPKCHEQVEEHPLDPVIHWVATHCWPAAFREESSRMNQAGSGKRKRTSVHQSDYLKRLSEYGILMSISASIQHAVSQDDADFQTPIAPASVLQESEIAEIRELGLKAKGAGKRVEIWTELVTRLLQKMNQEWEKVDQEQEKIDQQQEEID